MKSLTIISTSLSLIMITACAPRISYVEPVGAFSTQAEKLGKAVTTELANFNTTRRIDYLRQDTFQKVRSQISGKPQNGSGLRELDHYLCRPTELSVEYSNGSNYLNSIAAGLKDVSGEPDKKTEDLLKALVHSYGIEIPATPNREINSQCHNDLIDYYTTAYPTSQREFAAPAAIEGAQALWKIFDTLANAVLQQVDEARRAEALREFFADSKNVESLKMTINNNAKFLSESASARRHLDVRNVNRAYANIQEKYSKLNIKNIPGCKPLLMSPPQAALEKDKGFQNCFDDVWDSNQKEITQFLEASAAYDKDAAIAPDTSANELNKAIDALADIATNKNIDTKRFGQMVEALMNAASAISTLNDKLTEEDTQKSIKEALAKFTTPPAK
ncbi:hypothetical protein [Pseudomonas sp. B21-010]|uniref:hypothetical protein n=1 Tax=Pseudomonas sp. B21-010 TaxID=2895471 RepID=UPI0021601EA1|nr:hypothetical protein [Pseudomonas sp. B21-010]UVM59100.1 hypothetical protein LOY50_16185 [Pseudomonas sp. B21-010]